MRQQCSSSSSFDTDASASQPHSPPSASIERRKMRRRSTTSLRGLWRNVALGKRLLLTPPASSRPITHHISAPSPTSKFYDNRRIIEFALSYSSIKLIASHAPRATPADWPVYVWPHGVDPHVSGRVWILDSDGSSSPSVPTLPDVDFRRSPGVWSWAQRHTAPAPCPRRPCHRPSRAPR